MSFVVAVLASATLVVTPSAAFAAGAPNAPTAVTAVAGNSAATVSWTAGASDGTTVTGYQITPYTGSTALPSTSFASIATSETLSGLTVGTSYTFTVVATSASGPSAASTASNAVTPTGFATAPSGAQIAAALSQYIEVAHPTVTYVPVSAPQSESDGSGGSFTAVVGESTAGVPTSTGQLVFFFHDATLVGLDSAAEKYNVTSLDPSGTGSFTVGYLAAAGSTPTSVTFTWNGSAFTGSGTPPGDGTAVAAAPATITTGSSENGVTAGAEHADVVGTTRGTLGAPIGGIAGTHDSKGYWMFGEDGGLFNFGDAGFHGSLGGMLLNQPVVGGVGTPDSGGYWMTARDGGVFNFGDANFYGSMGGKSLNKPVVGMAATPDGKGYWLVGADGGIFNYGDAGFYGSMGGQTLNAPVVGIAATPDGKGYWLVGADGGIFAFGDAGFYGSMGGKTLAKPVVGIAASPDGKGYWLVGADGGIFNFGDAAFEGSMGGKTLVRPITGIAATSSGNGYWLVGADGGLFAFGNAPGENAIGVTPTGISVPALGIAPYPYATYPPTGPPAPTNVMVTLGNCATATNCSVGVSWTEPVNTSEPAVTAFQVNAYTSGSNLPVVSTTTTGTPPPTSLVVSGLVQGTAYYVEVFAINTFTYQNSTYSADSVASAPVSFTTAPTSAGPDCRLTDGCTPQQFSDLVLAAIGAPVTGANEYGIETWARAEGGGAGCPGQPAMVAPWQNSPGPAGNPMDTTQPEPGSTVWNGANVQIYADSAGQTCWHWGVLATVQTLTNGLYPGVLTALRSPPSGASDYTQCVDLAVAVGNTHWGTGNFSVDC